MTPTNTDAVKAMLHVLGNRGQRAVIETQRNQRREQQEQEDVIVPFGKVAVLADVIKLKISA